MKRRRHFWICRSSVWITKHPSQAGKYPVKLRPNSFKKVIDAFEKKLTTAFFYPPAGRRLTYSDAIIYQAGHFRKVIEGEANVYIPVMLK